MKKKKFTLLLALGLFVVSSFTFASTENGQELVEQDGRPPQARVRIVSPEIADNGAVTFRLNAPNAESVIVSGELDGQDYPMTKKEDGIWTVTTNPLPPDIYTYSFRVDGLSVLDPVNANTKYGYGNYGAISIVQVPGDGPQFYDVKDVPHGKVSILPYESKTLGVARTAWIYTPPGYENGDDYPVLYLYHGAGDIESGWTMIGRANNILDNLIAEGKAEPMVVVMPLGQSMQSFWTGPSEEAVVTQDNGAPVNRNSLIESELLNDIIPMIENEFKVATDPDNRAIGGLSMGGMITQTVGFNHPDLFHSIIIMSSGFQNAEENYPDFFANPGSINDQLKLFWIAVGADDSLARNGSDTLHEQLLNKGIDHIYEVTEGRHEWTVWRHHLYQFAPLLFK